VNRPHGPRVVGFDGCRDGWVAVHLRDGQVEEVAVVRHLAEVLDGARQVTPDAIGVDIPIGLLDGPVRDADVAARRTLPGRAASVFSAPPRAVVDLVRGDPSVTHARASALAVEVSGRGISQQAFRLVPKIAEVDALVAAGVEVAEVHPEVAFAVVAGAPLPRKTSWAGMGARREQLAALGITLPTSFPGADRCAPDDVVDAAICAWVADGVAGAGPVLTLPPATRQTDRGRPIVIVARQPPSEQR
jgi:predicted RNase H-like nuclease